MRWRRGRTWALRVHWHVLFALLAHRKIKKALASPPMPESLCHQPSTQQGFRATIAGRPVSNTINSASGRGKHKGRFLYIYVTAYMYMVNQTQFSMSLSYSNVFGSRNCFAPRRARYNTTVTTAEADSRLSEWIASRARRYMGSEITQVPSLACEKTACTSVVQHAVRIDCDCHYHSKSITHDAIKGLVYAAVRKCNYLRSNPPRGMAARRHQQPRTWAKDGSAPHEGALSVASNGTF
jgi:hypothetical protein